MLLASFGIAHSVSTQLVSNARASNTGSQTGGNLSHPTDGQRIILSVRLLTSQVGNHLNGGNDRPPESHGH
jgi:hypothetical protein